MSGLFILLVLIMLVAVLIYSDASLIPDNQIELIDQIDELLPQTQCGKCNYPGCRPYAEAIANNDADINQCPPGGRNTIRKLANLLGRGIKPLNPHYGREGPKRIAYIDEAICIGCVKCIQACPVDAIVGTAKQMHTVIPQECTGCELCVEPCPVDCIYMLVFIQGGRRIRPDLNLLPDKSTP
jgi:Na+-translocating ferredoxin:NAD+ oxidoreductase subunit B